MPKFDLVIFDNDGVLVETEYVYTQVLLGLLKEQGIETTFDFTYKNTGGKGLPFASKFYAEHFNINLGEDFHEVWRQKALSICENNLEAVKGAKETIEALNLPYAVASNAHLVDIEKKHNIAGLSGLFNGKNTFSAYDHVENKKPAPDVYLYAASKMNHKPERCLVLEDTPTGIQAAKSAGMYVVGVSAGKHAQNVIGFEKYLLDAGADVVISDIRELLEIIK